MPRTIGQTIGRYRLVEQIGAGGMGVVYRAYDEKLERELAIKVLLPGTLHDSAARKRFRNEARALSRLNHPTIQVIHDFDSIDGHDLLISELIPGVSLDVRLATGPLSENEAVRIGVQLAQGLAAAHAAGVLHRDIKPSNLRLKPDGGLKILDFGLAIVSQDVVAAVSKTTESMTSLPSGVAGTLPYMSPEQLLGDAIDDRSDIYSAGVVLFELTTGHLPFTETLVPKLTKSILTAPPPAPSSFVAKISAELERIILKCLEKEAELRYQSAKELAADLRRLETASARVITAATSPPEIRRQRSNRRMIAGACAIALFVAAGAWWRARSNGAALPSLRWEQITNFNDSAQWPTVSSDGKLVAFLRGPGDGFGGSVSRGQIWFKPLPDGDAIQLSRTAARKITLAFSPDNARIFFTQVGESFTWNTYEIPLFGAQEPKLFMANATGLSWVNRDRLLFSSIKTGIHMALETSSASRSDQRDVYVPLDQVQGMVHRSALSPDGKWVLAVEMDTGWWERCRLVPFDGSNAGRPVGPEGECTSAGWSADGRWMYFTVNTAGAGSHIWRERFPGGIPQQLTPAGASEEEGLAVMPDGKSLITAAGAATSEIWLHDDKLGDQQISSEGYSELPVLSPDGRRAYYLMRRGGGGHVQFSGELWASDLQTGNAQRLFPGLLITQFAISADEKKVVFASAQGQERSGIWIAELDRTQPPRQLTFGGEYRAFFGRRGEILYQSKEEPPHLMRMNEDGTGRRRVLDRSIMQLDSVAPDGSWALVGAIRPGSHGEKNTIALVVPLNGGEPFTVCDQCSYGFGGARQYAPLLLWSREGRWIYVAGRYFGATGTTFALPTSPSDVPSVLRSIHNESDLLKIPGARALPQNDVYPLTGPSRYLFVRARTKTNLFRIYLSE